MSSLHFSDPKGKRTKRLFYVEMEANRDLPLFVIGQNQTQARAVAVMYVLQYNDNSYITEMYVNYVSYKRVYAIE